MSCYEYIGICLEVLRKTKKGLVRILGVPEEILTSRSKRPVCSVLGEQQITTLKNGENGWF
jgi:hypothetical protein